MLTIRLAERRRSLRFGPGRHKKAGAIRLTVRRA
jgi:hypothetical protein